MYHVSAVPRPPLVPFLLHCIWFGASRGALYGLICGAVYGVFFYLIGSLFGGPIGLVFGAVVGAIDGLICGVILHRRLTIFTAELDQATISGRMRVFKAWMGAFSFLACLFGGILMVDPVSTFSIERLMNTANLFFVVVPSLIAGLCGYSATGRLLRWYVRRWVLGDVESAALKHARNRVY
jgi:hypothetical protein